MASTYLTRTPSSTGSQTKFTFSFWWKNNCVHGNDKCFFSSGLNSSNYFMIRTTGNEQLELLALDNGSATMRYKPTRYYRDNNSFYHIVIAIDTTQSTSGDRLKWYTNGVRETAFDLNTTPNQNTNLLYVNDTTTHCIGRKNVTSDKYMDGTLSHYHFIDGTQYDASAFGETDATTGEWKANTSPSVTYGTNGFFVLKDGNDITDQSGEGNDFTLDGGTLTDLKDNPDNVFATWNPLDGATSLGNSTFTFGNTRWNSESGSNKCWTRSTLGITSGKYYFEMKIETPSNNCAIGISDRPAPNLTDNLGAGAYDYCYQSSNGETINNTTQSSGYGNSYTTNDIVMCALDLDNNKLYFGKNGTWQNSGDPTSGATGTGASYTVTAPSSTNGGAYFFCGADLTGANNTRLQANFGNGYFGTTAVSSAGTNASGIGIFEYDVPTGYTALSTKGLNL